MTKGTQNMSRSVSMTIDRSVEEPCEVTSLTHGFEAERRGRPLRLGSLLYDRLKAQGLPVETGSGGLTKHKQAKRVKGYQTGDIVRAVVTKGKRIGTYVGKVAVRTSGSFNITTTHGVVQGISHRSCTPIHRSDGYRYEKGEAAFPPVA